MTKAEKKRREQEILDAAVNGLGNPHFDGNEVVKTLATIAAEWQASGRNPGSLWAVANFLTGVTDDAKELYEQ